ncbi:MAG: rhodanese-like domain-containing protein [Saprospiraceae bacterium]|nr:rhodanese-like domain-containing protein [Saprospiraceae bacterium]
MLQFLKSIFRKDMFENLDVAAFLSQVKSSPDAVLLDVRTPAEVAAGALPSATNIDFQHPGFVSEIAKLDKEKRYYVYCRSGVRSANACRKMHEMGFAKLTNLVGGYNAVPK